MTSHHTPSAADAPGGEITAEELRTALAEATELQRRLSSMPQLGEGPGEGPGEGEGGAAQGPTGLAGVADRLADSVVRPLREALTLLDGASTGAAEAGPSGAPDGARASTGEVAAPTEVGATPSDSEGSPAVETLWRLAKDVTALRTRPGTSLQVQEAAAALQDLIWRLSPADDADGSDDIVGVVGRSARMAELVEIQAGLPPTIDVLPDGPYLVTNVATVTNWLGEPIPVRPQMALCRCGASAVKPWCDGSHARTGFTSALDPKRVPDRRDTHVGQQVTILDNRGICQHAGYCTDRLSTVFHADGEPFVTPSGGRMDEIIRAVRDCPSGALSFAIDGREAREQVDYDNTREPSIEVTKDGPYRITGGIALRNGAGDDHPRGGGASREHYALCRCGQSRNKPFCSGMHWYVDFHDPVPDPGHEPTIFEWCGGLPALTRMTRLFYEKHVPQDPLLAPVFADMSADHPERVAKWLAEVFCGPKYYSEQYGGYPRMLSQHLGKKLTEEMRARWASLMLQSALEAGLPNDPEFRSVFGAYIDWGSRLAVENSQIGARPPERMPMPHWDWFTAAGPPGSRISALAPPAPEDEQPVTLPAPDEPVSFEEHIKSMFRDRDRRSMSFAFDLWAYEDVMRHAEAILERLRDGSMPCDGAWPQDRIDAFQRWVDSQMPA